MGAAVLFALVIFVKKWQGGQGFDLKKFLATMFTALVIGVIAHVKGVPVEQVTADFIAKQLLTYGGVIMLFQFVIQILFNWIGKKRSKSLR
jgi:hypothetical protein